MFKREHWREFYQLARPCTHNIRHTRHAFIVESHMHHVVHRGPGREGHVEEGVAGGYHVGGEGAVLGGRGADLDLQRALARLAGVDCRGWRLTVYQINWACYRKNKHHAAIEYYIKAELHGPAKVV